MFKKLTGQDKIRYEFKNKGAIFENSYTKFISNSNALPTTTDNTDGFFSRFRIIDFPNQFAEGQNVVKMIPDIEYSNLALKVTEILPVLLLSGSFIGDVSIDERRRLYELKSNPLPLFIDVHFIKGLTEKVIYSQFLNMYGTYMKQIQGNPISPQKLINELGLMGYERRKPSLQEMNMDSTLMNTYYVYGLRLNTAFVTN
jgi:putative DNA primase/helicase